MRSSEGELNTRTDIIAFPTQIMVIHCKIVGACFGAYKCSEKCPSMNASSKCFPQCFPVHSATPLLRNSLTSGSARQ
ncbi:hypothetical protein B0H19DRAFT_1189076 [Mycena capillaripes]|nr:hypothetical protein B0H19DRAFT_1189076 [Mycena capillaripes]